MSETVETTERLTFDVPEAGAMVGLSRNAAYEAAKRGEIPIIKFGKLMRVPAKRWLKMLNDAGV